MILGVYPQRLEDKTIRGTISNWGEGRQRSWICSWKVTALAGFPERGRGGGEGVSCFQSERESNAQGFWKAKTYPIPTVKWGPEL